MDISKLKCDMNDMRETSKGLYQILVNIGHVGKISETQ